MWIEWFYQKRDKFECVEIYRYQSTETFAMDRKAENNEESLLVKVNEQNVKWLVVHMVTIHLNSTRLPHSGHRSSYPHRRRADPNTNMLITGCEPHTTRANAPAVEYAHGRPSHAWLTQVAEVSRHDSTASALLATFAIGSHGSIQSSRRKRNRRRSAAVDGDAVRRMGG